MTALKANSGAKPLKTGPRKPGRPRGGAINAEQREHLLDIALHLFAQQGIAETSLNAIARKAEVTPAMMNYYFRSREALLDIIIEERFLPLRSRIYQVFVTHADSPLLAIEHMVRELAATAQRDSWFAPLWMQEAVSESSPLRVRIQEKFGKEAREKILMIMEGWKQQGKINSQINTVLLMSSMQSLVLVPLVQLRVGNDDITREAIVQHALALLCKGISAD
ncbi:TetR/AcrR family transcriptional regulator [Erwinia sp.]|uniref:TetR/AcrR family transcriptional regulator n=1 Tax=Erwinia citreus TaxID=558 RepID=UPI003C772502